MRRTNIEPVRRAFLEPRLHVVGDLFGRADEHTPAIAGGHELVKIADVHVVPPRHIDQAGTDTANAYILAGIRYRTIDWVRGQIAKAVKQDGQSHLGMDQPAHLVIFGARLRLGTTNIWRKTRQHLNRVRRTSELHRPILNRCVVGLGRAHIERHRIHNVGIGARDLLPLFGRARLHQNWTALRRWRGT